MSERVNRSEQFLLFDLMYLLALHCSDPLGHRSPRYPACPTAQERLAHPQGQTHHLLSLARELGSWVEIWREISSLKFVVEAAILSVKFWFEEDM